MKKKIVVVVILITCLIIGVGAYFIFHKENIKESVSDAIKFKQEYESLNGKETSSGKAYRSIEIKEDNPFVYASAKDIIEMIENKDSFAIYFGFKSCPWCRSILPTLIDVAKELNIKKVYYVDVSEIRDAFELNADGKPVRSKEGSEDYYRLLELLDSVLSDYSLTNEKGKSVSTGEKRIYAPNIVSIVDGNAYKLTEGISELQNDGYMELTEEMLKDTYEQIKCTLDCLQELEACSLAC